MLNRLWLVLLFLAILGSEARSQSSPGLIFNQVPTAAQWNSYFAAKQDFLGVPPLLQSGGSLSGKLTLNSSASAGAGFNIGQGAAPSAPVNGDVWATIGGLFIQLNGTTFGPVTESRQIIPLSSSAGTLAQSTTGFMLANGICTAGTCAAGGAEASVEALAPIGGTFKNLYLLSTAPASGQTLTATWRINGGSSVVTCTITGPATSCNDTTHTATITAGQPYDLQVVTSATSGTINFIAGGVEFDNP